MKKIEMYYNKEKDCIQMVSEGVLKFHDEAINSCEFLSYFGDNVEKVDDLKNITVNEIIEGYDSLITDFKHNCGAKEVESYFENVAKEKICGDLVCSYEIN